MGLNPKYRQGYFGAKSPARGDTNKIFKALCPWHEARQNKKV